MENQRSNDSEHGKMRDFDGRFERAKEAGEFINVMQELMWTEEFRVDPASYTRMEALIDQGLQKFGKRAFYDAFAAQFPDIIDDFMLPPKE